MKAAAGGAAVAVAVDGGTEQREWMGAAAAAAAARSARGPEQTSGPGKEHTDAAVDEPWRARWAVGAESVAGSAGRQEAAWPEDEQAALEIKELGRIAMVECEAQRKANFNSMLMLLAIPYGLRCVWSMCLAPFTR